MLSRIIKKLKTKYGLFLERGKRRASNDMGLISPQELVADIAALEIPKDSIVFIHSGFKSIGNIQGGPEAVVDALIAELVIKKNITIAMPAFSISGTMLAQLQSGKVFDVKNTPTVFKAIPEVFLKHNDIVRSIHPTHSVAAIGSKANWLTEAHHTSDKTFGPDSPFGRLMSAGGFIMGLGSGLGAVTFYHTLEDHEFDFPKNVYTNESFEVECVDILGEKHKVKTKAHDPQYSEFRIDKRNSAWLKDIYTHYFEHFAGLKWQKVCKAKTWICNSRDFYNASKDLAYLGVSIYTSQNDLAKFLKKSIEKNS